MVEFPGGVPIELDYGQDRTTPNFAAIPTVSRSYVKKKVAFARSHNLGGISIFHITADDIDGWCFNQTYPILNAINDELRGCRFV
jgi:GH18 family chitinase